MTANVGNLDRLLRLVLGIVLVLAPFLLDLPALRDARHWNTPRLMADDTRVLSF